jgi:glycosyltransferase involved in cell wall biosynthesis
MLLKKFCRVKLIVHSHNIEGKRWKSLGKWWWPVLWTYEKYIHRQADYNFFVTDSDKQYAIRAFGLREELCLTVTFGTEISSPPQPEDTDPASDLLHHRYSVPRAVPLLLINGAFRYSPNLEALKNLLFRVNPILQGKSFPYLMLICGMDIPEKFFNETFPDVRMIGFADDLPLYLKGCDVFLNPVIPGGGIKTKLVEALGYNLNAVSTESGSAGIDPLLCNGKLIVCADNDWNAFAESIIQCAGIQSTIPSAFYEHFYWGNIASSAAAFIWK